MEKKINVAEILKDCPKGVELDCTIWDSKTKVFLKEVLNADFDYPIVVTVKYNNIECSKTFTKYGTYNDLPYCKCVIFPKGKTTWEGFVPPCQFKDGDILYCNVYDDGNDDDCYKYVFILKEIIGDKVIAHCFINVDTFTPTETYLTENRYPIRLATEEEKQKLFQAIKENGYKWNEETKTLEKLIEPKFKVGDEVKSIFNNNRYIITALTDTHYTLVEVNDGFKYIEPIIEDKHWELASNKFDINTLVPFESKVLIRNDEDQHWIPAFWGYKSDGGYTTTFGWCKYCIPFDGNENLLNTNNGCDEYYKTWE